MCIFFIFQNKVVVLIKFMYEKIINVFSNLKIILYLEEMLTSVSQALYKDLKWKVFLIKICLFNALEIEVFNFFNGQFLNLKSLKSTKSIC